MELIRPDTRYDFIGKKKFTIWISAMAILLSLGSIALHGGLKYGVDFAGGLLVQVKFANDRNFGRSNRIGTGRG